MMIEELDPAQLFLGDESRIIEFPAGLIGLDEWRKFILVSHPAGGTLHLLEAVDDKRVSLIVTDPKYIIPDYHFNLSKAEAELLQVDSSAWSTQLNVYCILSIQEEPLKVTANLLGPLLINWNSSLGHQIVLTDTNYSPRHLLVDHSASLMTEPVEGKEGEKQC